MLSSAVIPKLINIESQEEWVGGFLIMVVIKPNQMMLLVIPMLKG
jgi:hypothetical protein